MFNISAKETTYTCWLCDWTSIFYLPRSEILPEPFCLLFSLFFLNCLFLGFFGLCEKDTSPSGIMAGHCFLSFYLIFSDFKFIIVLLWIGQLMFLNNMIFYYFLTTISCHSIYDEVIVIFLVKRWPIYQMFCSWIGYNNIFKKIISKTF